MKKYIFIIILAIILMGCTLYVSVDNTVYSNGYKITVKIADRVKEYVYWYKLVDQENGNTLGWYTDKNFDVGHIIWMGAKWGRDMSKDVDLDN